MKSIATANHLPGGGLNTLAQNDTSSISRKSVKAIQILNGNGTDLSKTEALYKRVKKKSINQKVILSLIDVAKQKGDLEMIQCYWNTWHCQNKLRSAFGKAHGKYCGNRFCYICCGNRKAEIINKYYPVIKEWESPHLVTITCKAVSARFLKQRIEGMLKVFRMITKKFRRWHLKGRSIKLIGIKSLECNFNQYEKTYNPHFHIIVPNVGTGNIIIQEWCKYWGYKIAYRGAQDNKIIDNLQGALIEVIKYSSKVFNEPKTDKEKEQKIPPTIYASALHNMICAMKGERVFDRFGFDLPKRNKGEDKKAVKVDHYDDWIYDPKQYDWVNTEDSNQLLTGYVLTGELLNILENNIDTVLE